MGLYWAGIGSVVVRKYAFARGAAERRTTAVTVSEADRRMLH
jgi:hypothetical protein